MERFVVSKYLRPIVLSGLATSLLIGVLSAPAWAASTDEIANASPGVSPTTVIPVTMPSGNADKIANTSPGVSPTTVIPVTMPSGNADKIANTSPGVSPTTVIPVTMPSGNADEIANTSPSVSSTSGELQIPLNESLSQAILSNPKVHDWIMQQILSSPKVHDRIMQYLENKHNLKSNISPVVSPNGPSMPANTQKPSTPANGHNQSYVWGNVRYPSISEYEPGLSNMLDIAMSISNPDVARYVD